jgi:hypothetical protein
MTFPICRHVHPASRSFPMASPRTSRILSIESRSALARRSRATGSFCGPVTPASAALTKSSALVIWCAFNVRPRRPSEPERRLRRPVPRVSGIRRGYRCILQQQVIRRPPLDSQVTALQVTSVRIATNHQANLAFPSPGTDITTNRCQCPTYRCHAQFDGHSTCNLTKTTAVEREHSRNRQRTTRHVSWRRCTGQSHPVKGFSPPECMSTGGDPPAASQ